MRPVFPVGLLCVAATACQDYALVRPSHMEHFYQPDRETGVDILWVVDDSATMLEEHDLLIASAEAFISFVSNSGIDFRLGVISTDMDYGGGELRGDVLGPDTVGMVDAFNEQIVGQFTGSRDERGIDAASIGADPSYNGEFARNKADLELIFFSDEDDHSEMSVDELLQELKRQRGSGVDVKVHAVVGDPPEGCVSVGAAADAGTRYLEAQAATEGRRESICTADYGAMLARVALDVVGLEMEFALSKVPDVATMQVRVNEVIVHPRRRDGWYYNAGDNTLRFDGYGVPPPGATISAAFTEWYGPDDAQQEGAE
jgi:hypothetical protein